MPPAPIVNKHNVQFKPSPLVVLNYQELMAVVRARIEAIAAPNDIIEENAQLTRGHLGKLLGPAENKRLGMFTVWRLFDALGLQLAVVEHLDVDATREEMRHYRPHALRAHRGRLRKRISDALMHAVAVELGRKGGSKQKRFSLQGANRSAIYRANVMKRTWRPPKHRGRH